MFVCWLGERFKPYLTHAVSRVHLAVSPVPQGWGPRPVPGDNAGRALALLQQGQESLSPVLGPLVAGDMGWELLRCWGRDCQDETAGDGGFIPSTSAGRREMLSLFPTPLIPGEPGSPLPTSPIPGGFTRAW